MVLLQTLETLNPIPGGEITTIFFLPDIQIGTVAQWAAAFVAFAGLLLAAISARWAAKQWRLQYFTKEWASTIQFLIANPQFLNPNTNRQYKENYNDQELFQYQLVARLSIGYVDDLYHLRTGKYLNTWLRGSVRVFVYPHYWWFLENEDAYDKKFVKYINDTLRAERTQ